MLFEALTTSLIVVFLAITVLPLIARWLGIPVLVVEIVLGVVVGVSGLRLVPEHSLVEFFSSFGLVYLLFLAGLEISFEHTKRHLKEAISIAIVSLGVPFLAGFSISPLVGIHPLLLGTIFSTSSLGIIIPLTKQLELSERFRHTLLASIAIVELASIILLSLSIAFLTGRLTSSFALATAALVLLFGLPYAARKLKIKEWLRNILPDELLSNLEVRFAFTLIFVLGAISARLGFEGIVGAFLAGLVLSGLRAGRMLRQRLESFGYGLFIPLFFVFTGLKIDLRSVLADLASIEILVIVIVTGMFANVVGVFVASRGAGFGLRESASMGLFHTILTSLTIAAAEIASREGLITNDQFSIFILLAVVTAILGPTLGIHFLKKERTAAKQGVV